MITYTTVERQIVTTSPGSFTFSTPVAGDYAVKLVGGGGGGGHFDAKYYGGWSNWTYAGGGSGAYFYGLVRLQANVTYTVVVGAGGANVGGQGTSGAGGDSYIAQGSTRLVTAGGGSGCQCAQYLGAAYTGQGGKVTTTSSVITAYTNKTGNNGPYGVSGNGNWQYAASVYNGATQGYGSGGGGWADGDDRASSAAGYAGYFEIIYNDYAYQGFSLYTGNCYSQI